MQITRETAYGIGLAYPFRLDSTLSRPLVASGVSLVEMSIEQIINTDFNERPFLSRNGIPYGTRLSRALFESIDLVVDVFRYDVPRALNTWEPRIYVMEADVVQSSEDEHLVIGNIWYLLRATNSENNFVRPYRLQPQITP